MTFSAWPNIHPSWHPVLAPVADDLTAVLQQLQARRDAGEPIEPPADNVLRVFGMPFDAVKVLIAGQDPYPTPGHAVGLSFALHPHVRPIARSLANIFTELHADLGIEPASSGDLSAWESQGVMLLNRVLTVTAHQAGSHRNMGWEKITDAVIAALAQRQLPLVAILWGRQAQSLAPWFDAPATLVLEAPHPSPLSARRGFFGSRPFSQTNAFLTQHGVDPIDWATQPGPQQPVQSELF